MFGLRLLQVDIYMDKLCLAGSGANLEEQAKQLCTAYDSKNKFIAPTHWETSVIIGP